jgi:hypothetical protein
MRRGKANDFNYKSTHQKRGEETTMTSILNKENFNKVEIIRGQVKTLLQELEDCLEDKYTLKEVQLCRDEGYLTDILFKIPLKDKSKSLENY